MKRLALYCFYLTFLLSIATEEGKSQIAPPANASCSIFAEIITVNSAGEKTSLNFGRFSPGPQGGTIKLSPQSTLSIQGSGFKGSGVHNAASFYLSGESATYSITLPSQPVVLTHSLKDKTMLVEGWVSTPSPEAGTGTQQEGSQIVYVGATLKVGSVSDNPMGIYTGSYTITFDFN